MKDPISSRRKRISSFLFTRVTSAQLHIESIRLHFHLEHKRSIYISSYRSLFFFFSRSIDLNCFIADRPNETTCSHSHEQQSQSEQIFSLPFIHEKNNNNRSCCSNHCGYQSMSQHGKSKAFSHIDIEVNSKQYPCSQDRQRCVMVTTHRDC